MSYDIGKFDSGKYLSVTRDSGSRTTSISTFPKFLSRDTYIHIPRTGSYDLRKAVE